MSKPISRFKQNFILRNCGTMTVGEMAKRLRLPYGTVYCRLYGQGLLDVRRQDTADIGSAVCRRVLSMYVRGWYLEDISEAAGRSEQVCARIIARVFPDAAPLRRGAMLQDPPDSYTGMTQSQIRMEKAMRQSSP